MRLSFSRGGGDAGGGHLVGLAAAAAAAVLDDHAADVDLPGLDREQAIASLSQAAKRISKGITVLVFPEGTRSSNGELKDFKKGGFMLALEAQVPIIPVGVSGTRSIVPRGEWRFKPGTVGVSMGDPIPTAGLTVSDRDALMRTVRDALLREKERASSLRR